MVPFYFEPMPDELLYSYIQRLAIANGLPYPLLEHAYALRPEAAEECRAYRPRRDSANDFGTLYHNLNREEPLIQFFRNTTIFPGYVPLLPKTVLSAYVARWSFREDLTSLIPVQNSLISRLRICPKCMGEEIASDGTWYLHRSHQMVDAAACYIHGCPLLEYSQLDKFTELSDASLFRPMENRSPTVAYERFLHDLLVSGIQASLEDVLLLLQRADGQEARQFSEIKLNRIPSRRIAHSLFKVFGTVETFSSELPEREIEKEDCIRKAIIGQCQLTQEYRDDFIQLQCLTCGLTYLSTPYRVLQGFRCPECDSKSGKDVLLQRITREAYNGSYELTVIHLGTLDSLSLRHKPCGQAQWVNARRFVSGDLCCAACNQMTEEIIRQKIFEAGNGAFELTGFENGGQPIILHTLCGRQFTKRYEVFVRYPICPRCAIDNYRPLMKPVYMWDTMSLRSQRKREGGEQCLRLPRREKSEKVGAQVPVPAISLGSK